ncbi:MAG: alkaline phosphatase family protein [Acidobacteria bacterium]|nr:alkaline phosphatase family protein [Acidobacteriota bacterium]MCW5969239.1 alkaline phosphatase family protein [Blastocatellales bacterium]
MSKIRALIAFAAIIGALIVSQSLQWAAPQASRARLIIVFVVDGLRPDSINAEVTPTIDRLRREGVHYINAHSVFPTVTRVNAAAISTGAYPGRNGLVSNSMFYAGVYPNRAFNTGDYRELLKLAASSGERLLFTRSLGERLTQRGIGFAAVSSGSTGNALLLNHRAPKGIGILVNGHFEPGRRVAFPDRVNSEMLSRFGPAPAAESSALVDWTGAALRDYILPEHRPTVVIDWLTEPDGAQHRYGVDSPEARRALANSDRNIGLTLAKAAELGLGDALDVFVLSDHGFSLHDYGVNVAEALIGAGLKSAADSDDVVIASNGQSVLLHVKNRDRAQIAKIVRFLHAQSWADVVFTSAGRKGTGAAVDPLGWCRGTFSLELIHEANGERGPDILFTLPWSSGLNQPGVAGTHYTTTSGATGPMTGAASGHGGMSPWSVRNTIIAWGAHFRRSTAVRVPASNVDIAPTILELLGITGIRGADEMDGRILREALRDGPDPEQVIAETRIHRAAAGPGNESLLQTTTVGRQRYIDKSWRLKKR